MHNHGWDAVGREWWQRMIEWMQESILQARSFSGGGDGRSCIDFGIQDGGIFMFLGRSPRACVTQKSTHTVQTQKNMHVQKKVKYASQGVTIRESVEIMRK